MFSLTTIVASLKLSDIKLGKYIARNTLRRKIVLLQRVKLFLKLIPVYSQISNAPDYLIKIH